ncbi:hypothetical protein VTJ49DRAFT_3020 [Mycothermus thermophilus]|uniref:Bromo domain-containing protein n=1 Tax=Humicola insolens TaxID=85995 RepID=A0ABR3V8P8_HUMIN
MDNKRKASSFGAGIADGDDRAGKRIRTPGPPSEYNLLEGETRESTTAYGLHFLETIRRTKDKSGRLVASYFENLLPRETNKEYYDRIRMPISLRIIERKLQNQEFSTLSEFESYFKRMVNNAKEFYPKNSEIFEDAERVRKALSNYMVKTNPAYKLNHNYSCQAAPVVDTFPDPEFYAPAMPGDVPAVPKPPRGQGRKSVSRNSEDRRSESKNPEEMKPDEIKAESNAASPDSEEDAEGEEDDDGEDEGPRKIVLKRRGGRGGRAGSEQAGRKTDKAGRVKADHEYEGVPYKGLTFQQAQEKIVEELIRKPDGNDPYFLDFINLPPRSYKDYFAVITNPLSLKGLQKLIKGIHGRQPATGVSDFKSWAQLEEKASLLWNNAHFYNEEGSVIYTLATELKECFEKELAEAKAVVQEPPQPKIKLKMTPGQETPISVKKITIHVGGSRSSTAASPAPHAGPSSDAGRPDIAQDGARTASPAVGTTNASFQIDTSNVAPATGPGHQHAPAGYAQTNGNVPGGAVNGGRIPPQAAQGPPHAQQQQQQPLQNGQHHPAQQPKVLHNSRFRAPGRGLADALIPSVLLRTHPTLPEAHTDDRFRREFRANPREAHQSFVIRLDEHNHRMQCIVRLAPLEQQLREYNMFVLVNGQMVYKAAPLPVADDPIPPGAVVFDVFGLAVGMNTISVQICAAVEKGARVVNEEGQEVAGEVERMDIYAQLMRNYPSS